MLASMAELPSTHVKLERWEDAGKWLETAMERFERACGVEDQPTSVMTYHLESTYRSPRRWEDADKLYTKVVRVSEKVLGKANPSILGAQCKQTGVDVHGSLEAERGLRAVGGNDDDEREDARRRSPGHAARHEHTGVGVCEWREVQEGRRALEESD